MSLWMALVCATGLAVKAHIQDLSWLEGSWVAEEGSARIEEHWTPARGRTLFGVSRTIIDDDTVAFEYLRIVSRESGIFYIAQPDGRAEATEFALTSLEGETVVFANPEHDFPKLIRYRRGADGSVHVEVEGDENGQPRRLELHFRRASSP